MLTCYIKNSKDVKNRLLVSVFHLIPIVLIVYGIYQLVKIYKGKMFDHNEEMKKVVHRNTIYILVYFGLNSLLVLLYMLSLFIDVTQSNPMQIISFVFVNYNNI